MSSIMRKQVDNVNHVDSSRAVDENLSAEPVLELVHTVMHQFRSLQYQVLRDGAFDVTHMTAR